LPEWYETFFDALANDVWRALVPVEISDAEAAFLVRQLRLPDQGARRLLDVPCGDGRLALRLAALGHDVVGVDLSDYAIGRLRADDPRCRVDARVGDLRDLPAALSDAESFDGAWCMGNSFGYLGPLDTVAFITGLSARVRPGGRLVLDAATAAEVSLANLGERDRHEAGNAVLTNVHAYEVRTSTIVTHMTLSLGDERDERVARHRVMTCREIVDVLDGANFDVEEIAGGLDGQEFRIGASRCLITARRR
jgi:SAM-dependent methyltransferase